MTHDATAPVIPDVSVQVDDVDACHAAAVQAGAELFLARQGHRNPGFAVSNFIDDVSFTALRLRKLTTGKRTGNLAPIAPRADRNRACEPGSFPLTSSLRTSGEHCARTPR
jgi:hypothetical protein